MSMAEFAEKNHSNEQSLSQEGVVNSNPLAELKPLDRELSPSEKTVLWANRVFEEYNGLSLQTGKERKKAKGLISETAKQLLKDPDKIDTAVGVWRSHGRIDKSQLSEQDSFYDLIRQKCSAVAEKNWESIAPTQLAQLVKIYANSPLSSEFAQDVLTNYFKGPTSRKQRVDAYYNFAFAVLDLSEDQKAFNEAIRIGLRDTTILPRNSKLFSEVRTLNVIPWNVDKRTLQKHIVSGSTIEKASFFASEDFSLVRDRNFNYLSSSLEIKEACKEEARQSMEKLGATKTSQIASAMAYFSKIYFTDDTLNNDVILELSKEFPGDLILDEKEPLNKRYAEVFGAKGSYGGLKRVLVEYARERNMDELIFLSFPSPDNLFIHEVAFPRSLIGEKRKVLEIVLNDLKISEAEVKEINEAPHHILTSPIGLKTWVYKKNGLEIPVFSALRKLDQIEQNYHPLQALGTIGFPTPNIGNEINLANKNQQLADEIRKSQIRFLNKRGVKIPLENSLKEFGYSHIDFYKASDDPEKILVKIFVGETPYSVKLDKYFNFDFEGKRFDVPFLHDALKFTLLSYLKPVLCEEKVKTPKGEMKELDTEVVSRMGHLRWLTHNQRFSKQAVENCFKFEGKDLFVLALERQELHKGTEKEKMETTYVKPVMEKEENLPPITLHLPGILRFKE